MVFFLLIIKRIKPCHVRLWCNAVKNQNSTRPMHISPGRQNTFFEISKRVYSRKLHFDVITMMEKFFSCKTFPFIERFTSTILLSTTQDVGFQIVGGLRQNFVDFCYTSTKFGMCTHHHNSFKDIKCATQNCQNGRQKISFSTITQNIQDFLIKSTNKYTF